MAVWGRNGLIRKQEMAFAKKLLEWKYNNAGMTVPDDKTLTAYAQKIVDDAHVIAKKSGSNIIEIMKQAVRDMRK